MVFIGTSQTSDLLSLTKHAPLPFSLSPSMAFVILYTASCHIELTLKAKIFSVCGFELHQHCSTAHTFKLIKKISFFNLFSCSVSCSRTGNVCVCIYIHMCVCVYKNIYIYFPFCQFLQLKILLNISCGPHVLVCIDNMAACS